MNHLITRFGAPKLGNQFPLAAGSFIWSWCHWSVNLGSGWSWLMLCKAGSLDGWCQRYVIAILVIPGENVALADNMEWSKQQVIDQPRPNNQPTILVKYIPFVHQRVTINLWFVLPLIIVRHWKSIPNLNHPSGPLSGGRCERCCQPDWKHWALQEPQGHVHKMQGRVP